MKAGALHPFVRRARTEVMTDEDRDTVEVQCPECKKSVRVSKTKAEKDMKTKCPNGHEIQLMKALF